MDTDWLMDHRDIMYPCRNGTERPEILAMHIIYQCEGEETVGPFLRNKMRELFVSSTKFAIMGQARRPFGNGHNFREPNPKQCAQVREQIRLGNICFGLCVGSFVLVCLSHHGDVCRVISDQ